MHPVWLYRLCSLFLIVVLFYLHVIHASQSYLMDFEVYLEAGKRLAAGQDIYSHVYEKTTEHGKFFTLYYFYPPIVAGLFASLHNIDYQVIKTGWCLLGFLSVVVTAIFSHSLFPLTKERSSNLCVMLFLFLCFEPIYWGAREGQVGSILLALPTFEWVINEERVLDRG